MPKPDTAPDAAVQDAFDRAGRLCRRGTRAAAAQAIAKVLTMAPRHPGALCLRVDLDLAWRDYASALRSVEEGLRLCPGEEGLLVRKGEVLRRTGAPAAAVSFLRDMVRRCPLSAPLRAALAEALRETGDADGAETLLRSMPGGEAGEHLALIGRAEALLQAGATQEARALMEQAAARWPEDPRVLRLLAKVLGRMEATAEAIAVLRRLHEARPGDRRVLMDLAGKLRASGDSAGAETLLESLPDWAPEQHRALSERVTAALAVGEVPAALALSARLVAGWPQDVAALRLRATALGRARRTAEALQLLRQAAQLAPQDGAVRLDLARALAAQGHHTEAEDLLRSLAPDDPLRPRALEGLADLALDRLQAAPRRHALAQELLAALRGGQAAEAADAALLMAICRLTFGADPCATFTRAFAQLVPLHRHLRASQQLALLDLAERLGRSEAAQAVEATLLSSGRLDRRSAVRLVQRALASGAYNPAGLADRLCARIPQEQRRLFRAQSASLLQGSAAAIAVLRQPRSAPRSPMEAASLASNLAQEGLFALALRYLAACRRRWPQDADLLIRQARTLSGCGRGPEALDLLARAAADQPDLAAPLEPVRGEILFQMGALDAADALFEALAGANPLGHLRSRMQLALIRNDQARIDRLAALMADRPGSGAREVMQFSLTILGTKRNETLLEEIAAGQGAQILPDRAERLRDRAAGTLFFSAAAVLDNWCQRPEPAPPAEPAGAAILRAIFQYWDRPPLPDALGSLTETWKSAPGFTHVLFDRTDALRFLQQHLGAPWVRAFHMANHPAEESDLIRLCWLLVRGGVYADTDDRRLAPLDRLLLPVRRLLLVREPMGSLANNFIAAAPGHPALGRAALMARDALLRRENDNTWSKTGPGLLTRAVAQHLTAEGSGGADLTILPQHAIAPFVQVHVPQPYKQTSAYWANVA